MLSKQYRMKFSSDFNETVRLGLCVVQSNIVVYGISIKNTNKITKVGLIVSKNIGNSVERHRVSRLIRHNTVFLLLNKNYPYMIVIRAKKNRNKMSFSLLRNQLQYAFNTLDIYHN